MNVHTQLPNKISHKLFYGQYTSRLDLHASFILTTRGPDRSFKVEKSLWKYKNLVSPFKAVLEGIEYKPRFIFDQTQYPGEALVETFQTQCQDLINFYQFASQYQHLIGKSQWTVDPAYAPIDATEMAVTFKFRYYFKQRDQLIEFFDHIKSSQHIDIFQESQICEINHRAEEIIAGDRYVTVMRRLPYKKYTGRLWLNYSRLRKMSSNERINSLKVLEAYEEQRLIKCQPLLKKFLQGHQKFLWNDPYIYVEDDSIKNMLDLVLVNIITRQERIVLENG